MIHLAVDIGASSGRHIVSFWKNGERTMQEVYRFSNLPQKQDGHLVWDIGRLCDEVVNGLAACRQKGIIPDSVGIDTWGVDYVLLDGKDEPILPVFSYRDGRGMAASEAVHNVIPFETLYRITGIQYQPFNTIYQFYDDKGNGRLEQAADFLMIPEYLTFVLCGKKEHEYTNASTTGLLNVRERCWDRELIAALGLPERLFDAQPKKPPVILGKLKKEIADRVGFCCDVVLPATHDTASAVASLPTASAYLSSGTWSLLGVQTDKPVTSDAAMAANFTNEGGVGTIRLLKNIMGMWLVQCLQREYDKQYSFAQLAEMAREEASFDYRLDVNDARYLSPESVREEIKKECEEKGFPVPETPGQFAHAIYQSLAHAYADAIGELERITGKMYGALSIVGGGVNNEYLNELTGKAIKRPVVKGSPEATALGNIMMQEEAYHV